MQCKAPARCKFRQSVRDIKTISDSESPLLPLHCIVSGGVRYLTRQLIHGRSHHATNLICYLAFVACLLHLREGDTLHVHSMDRLARNLDDLRRIVKDLNGRGVVVRFHKEGLSFTGEDSPMSNLLLSMLGGSRRVRALADP